MPASRSARAMIFAPRSCPSSPGLATTTRIFPAMQEVYLSSGQTTEIENGCLAPHAPHLAQRVAHLPHRHVGAGRIDDGAHQVAVVAGGIFLQPAERSLDGSRVALCLQCLHAVDLLLLERRVDLEDL